MAIHLNLLAEAQALEEMRRRDPVKRAVIIGIGLVGLMLAWSSSLQLKAMLGKSEVSRLEGEIASRNAEYLTVLESQRKLTDVEFKLASLQRLATNRVLHGTILNALQQTIVPDIQLMRFKTELSYLLNEEVKAKTNSSNKVTPGKPATVTERVLLSLDARDTAAVPGDQVNKYKQAILECPQLQLSTGITNDVKLASLSPPQVAPDTKPFVTFTLQCRYPEITR